MKGGGQRGRYPEDLRWKSKKEITCERKKKLHLSRVRVKNKD